MVAGIACDVVRRHLHDELADARKRKPPQARISRGRALGAVGNKFPVRPDAVKIRRAKRKPVERLLRAVSKGQFPICFGADAAPYKLHKPPLLKVFYLL